MIKCFVVFPNGNVETQEFKTLNEIKELFDKDKLKEVEAEYWNIGFRGFYEENNDLDLSPLGYALFNKDVTGRLIIPYVTSLKKHFISEVHTALFEEDEPDTLIELLQMKPGRVVYVQSEELKLPILRIEDNKFVFPLTSLDRDSMTKKDIFLSRTFLEKSIGKHFKLISYLGIFAFVIALGFLVQVFSHSIIASMIISIILFIASSDIFLRFYYKKMDVIYNDYMDKIFKCNNLKIGG